MQIHNLKKENKNKKNQKVGRGGKRGKTSGRGHKGQNARAGNKKRPAIRDVIKKLPKQRGYRFNSRRKAVIVEEKDLVSKEGKKESFSELRKRLGFKGSKIKIKKSTKDK